MLVLRVRLRLLSRQPLPLGVLLRLLCRLHLLRRLSRGQLVLRLLTLLEITWVGLFLRVVLQCTKHGLMAKTSWLGTF
ncbi:hypothetical protein Gohar_001637 [Gossypium harknessii]|uniref:Uncharacterized protein n=1 Tax=Gossypium harknessii TaxID=34285 RepID=A0A7J9I4K8_9ROSI|nr:hypothetical protein [Gossypium harknessii]